MPRPRLPERILHGPPEGVSGRAEAGSEARFDPLANMPADLPATRQRRCRKLAEKADHQYRAAVELKCIECCAWQRSEVKRCAVRSCPLWLLRRRIFGDGAGS